MNLKNNPSSETSLVDKSTVMVVVDNQLKYTNSLLNTNANTPLQIEVNLKGASQFQLIQSFSSNPSSNSQRNDSYWTTEIRNFEIYSYVLTK